MAAIIQSAILLVALFSITSADYECLCNYHVERTVYPDMTDQDKPLGHLYEFDCKPTYWSQTPGNWQTIQFEHKVGYVAIDVQIKLQTCPGDVPITDAVQTTSTSKTTSVVALFTTKTDGTAYSSHPTLFPSTPSAIPNSAFVSTPSSTSPITAAATSLSPSSKTSFMVSNSTLETSTSSSVLAKQKLFSSTPFFNITLSQYLTTSKQSTTIHSESLQPQSKTASLKTAPTPSKITPLQTLPTQSETIALQSITRHSKTTSKQATQTQHKPSQTQSSLIQSKTTPIQTTPTQSKTSSLKVTWTVSEISPLQTTSTQSVTTGLQVTSTQSVISPLATWSPHSVTSPSESRPTQIHKTISSLLPTGANASSLSTKPFATMPATFISTDRRTTSILTTLPTLTGSSSTEMFTGTTQSQTTRAPQCPPHLTRSQYLKEFGSHCYEFILGRSRQWQPAEDDCRDKAGHLVTIRSNAEQNFIYHTLRSLNFHGDNGVWIGLTDKDREGHWRWSSGEKVTFTSWSDHQPGHKDCALFDMRHHGHWDDYKCKGILHNHQRHGWICEYHKL